MWCTLLCDLGNGSWLASISQHVMWLPIGFGCTECRYTPAHKVVSVCSFYLATSNAWDADYCDWWSWAFVSLTVMRLCCVNSAEWITVQPEVEALVDRRNIVFDRSPNFPHRFNAAFARLLWPLVQNAEAPSHTSYCSLPIPVRVGGWFASNHR